MHFSSEQWWNSSFGEPGWDPETSSTFPQRRPPTPVSHLPGDRPATSRTAGPTALESERKGQHEHRIIKYLLCTNATFLYLQLWSVVTILSIHRERFSPNCERGVHTAHVTLYLIRKMMKQPIMCFGSSFLAIRWSSVRVFNLPALPAWANLIKHHQRLHLRLHYSLNTHLQF